MLRYSSSDKTSGKYFPGKDQRHKVFLSDEGPKLETLDFTIRIGSTPTISFIFRFVPEHCLTQHTTFTSKLLKT